jgi:hypothetical protein
MGSGLDMTTIAISSLVAPRIRQPKRSPESNAHRDPVAEAVFDDELSDPLPGPDVSWQPFR